MANTAFEVRVSNNEWDNLCNITGKYKVSSDYADCAAGTLCVRGDKLPCEGFSGVYNENAYEMSAAASTATINDVIYACNTYDSQKVSNGVNAWHVGRQTLGLPVLAGEYGTFTKIVFNGENIYRFGVGNTDDVGEGDYYTIDDGGLATAASAPTTAGAIYFEVVGTGTFTEGASASFGYVDVRACANVIATA